MTSDHIIPEEDSPEQSSAADLFQQILDHFDRTYTGLIPVNQTLQYVTNTYLDSLTPNDPPNPMRVEQRLLTYVNGVYARDNEGRKAGNKTPLLRHLTPWQVAQCLLRLHRVVKVRSDDPKARGGALAMYHVSGFDEGLYVEDEDGLRQCARRYDTSLTTTAFREVLAVLDEDAPKVPRCTDCDLVAVNNGVFNFSSRDRTVTIGGKEFDFKAKSLHPFDPHLIFMSKSRIDYNPDAENVVIHNDADGTNWDVESWMDDLFDDPERVHLGWSALNASIRPNVSWNKAVLLYNESGNNGKGSWMTLDRNLVGAGSWCRLSIAEFDKPFQLAKIIGKSVVLSDENDVGAFTEKMANFKAFVTGDVVPIERKHRDPYDYQPSALTFQCLNSQPKSKDVSSSYYRRLLFWPFDKSFEGCENRAIKDDYLHRREVLEYVLKRVLHMEEFYELPEPAVSKAVLAEFKKSNDMVREFWFETEPELVWTLQPWEFLHDLFIGWSERTNPRGGGLKRQEFRNRLLQIVAEDGTWEDGQFGTSTHMDDPEPLIAEYGLSRWSDPRYTGSDVAKRCRPILKPKYRGLRRVIAPAPDPDLTAIVDELMPDAEPD